MISSLISTSESFVKIFEAAQLFAQRSIISRNINTLYGVLRRIKVQKVENNENKNEGSGHPAYDYVRPLLPIILQYVKTIHSLVEIPQLRFLLDMSDGEKSQVLGIPAYVGSSTTPFAKPLPVTNGLTSLVTTPSPDSPDLTQPKKIKVDKMPLKR